MEIRIEWRFGSGSGPRLSQHLLCWIINPWTCDWLKMKKAALMVWISLLVQGQLCKTWYIWLFIYSLFLCLLFSQQFLNINLLLWDSPPCSSLATSVSHGAQGHYARKLLSDLMKNYSNALRPVEDTDEALNVSLQITLSQIKDMVSRNFSLNHLQWNWQHNCQMISVFITRQRLRSVVVLHVSLPTATCLPLWD